MLDVTYEYDAFGELIQKSDGTVTSRYGADGWNTNMAAPTSNENMNTWMMLTAATSGRSAGHLGQPGRSGTGPDRPERNNYTLFPMQDRQESVTTSSSPTARSRTRSPTTPSATSPADEFAPIAPATPGPATARCRDGLAIRSRPWC